MDDVLVAYGQNGEAPRPGNGYPLRLIVPGWEGNVNVKWLRRIKVVDRPYMTRMEAPDHTSLLPNGKARQFLFVMEAKSVITFPSGGQQLPGPGLYEISGLAWSGAGAVRRPEAAQTGRHGRRRNGGPLECRPQLAGGACRVGRLARYRFDAGKTARGRRG
jgi:sulfane dehydrogenase subunit SoxC